MVLSDAPRLRIDPVDHMDALKESDSAQSNVTDDTVVLEAQEIPSPGIFKLDVDFSEQRIVDITVRSSDTCPPDVPVISLTDFLASHQEFRVRVGAIFEAFHSEIESTHELTITRRLGGGTYGVVGEADLLGLDTGILLKVSLQHIRTRERSTIALYSNARAALKKPSPTSSTMFSLPISKPITSGLYEVSVGVAMKQLVKNHVLGQSSVLYEAHPVSNTIMTELAHTSMSMAMAPDQAHVHEHFHTIFSQMLIPLVALNAWFKGCHGDARPPNYLAFMGSSVPPYFTIDLPFLDEDREKWERLGPWALLSPAVRRDMPVRRWRVPTYGVWPLLADFGFATSDVIIGDNANLYWRASAHPHIIKGVYSNISGSGDGVRDLIQIANTCKKPDIVEKLENIMTHVAPVHTLADTDMFTLASLSVLHAWMETLDDVVEVPVTKSTEELGVHFDLRGPDKDIFPRLRKRRPPAPFALVGNNGNLQFEKAQQLQFPLVDSFPMARMNIRHKINPSTNVLYPGSCKYPWAYMFRKVPELPDAPRASEIPYAYVQFAGFDEADVAKTVVVTSDTPDLPLDDWVIAYPDLVDAATRMCKLDRYIHVEGPVVSVSVDLNDPASTYVPFGDQGHVQPLVLIVKLPDSDGPLVMFTTVETFELETASDPWREGDPWVFDFVRNASS
jgi:hypothetical protein